MRVLVCGGRDYRNREQLFAYLDTLDITEVIHGGAAGADSLAGVWAHERRIEQTVYPANWALHGRKAGPIRNIKMLDESNPDVVIAFPGGPGTRHMMSIARKRGYRVLDVAGEDYHPPWQMQLKFIEEEP